MQVRWNYKLQPNKGQDALASEWLVTLRKHRNYSLRERETAYNSNNIECDWAVRFSKSDRMYGPYQDPADYALCSPLTCAVVKHGVVPYQLADAKLIKTTKEKEVKNKEIGEIELRPSKITWDSAGGIQSKRTAQLRSENDYFGRVESNVFQSNLSKLDSAFTGFWQHKRGFPAYRTTANFNSFQFKPDRVRLEINTDSKQTKTGKRKRCYSHATFPGLGRMRFLDNRLIPADATVGTITVMREADGWYMSVLLDLHEELPAIEDREIKSAVGIDVGINKLVSLSDGSFIENPRFATNQKTRRQFRIRQRRVNRKVKGSNNRSKAGIQVARLHKKVADNREAYQWQAANKVVNTADAVVREDLNIKGMKSRCKTKREAKGRAIPNGQSAKRGLNRSISDAAWGGLFQKVEWLATKAGKPVLPVKPQFTSQECRGCGHVSKENRDGEKFVCEKCGHIDHADTQASRTILDRAGFVFVRKDIKILPVDCGKVTLVRHAFGYGAERKQDKNRTSKAMPENRILDVVLAPANSC